MLGHTQAATTARYAHLASDPVKTAAAAVDELGMGAGFDDAAILEVLLVVVLNTYTNYTNHLARTDLDFPAAEALAA